jgi:hypothetical protein
MTYSVYQHWDPLKVCVVGKSYPPEFYEFIENSKLRTLFQKIATETEEDYQFIIKTLQKLGVRVIRPNVPNIQLDEYLTSKNRIPPPISMIPRDQLIMIGEKFFVFPYDRIAAKASGRIKTKDNTIKWDKNLYQEIKGIDWPQEYTDFEDLPQWIQDESKYNYGFNYNIKDNKSELGNATAKFNWWDPIVEEVKSQGNNIIENINCTKLDHIKSNGITRVGKDLYFGIGTNTETVDNLKLLISD